MFGLSSLKGSQCFPKAHIGTLRHRFRQVNRFFGAFKASDVELPHLLPQTAKTEAKPFYTGLGFFVLS
jgi:hypothetical protein